MSEAPVAAAIQATAQEAGFKVFVGNLSTQTKDEQLSQAFAGVGSITKAEVIHRHKRHMGYGFVTFAAQEDAIKAVSTLDKTEIDGRPINVELAKPPTAARVAKEAAAEAATGEEGEIKAKKPRNKRRNNKGPRKPRTDGETEEAGDAPAAEGEKPTSAEDGEAAATNGGARRRQPRRRGPKKENGEEATTNGNGEAAPRAPRAPRKTGPPTGELSKTLLFVHNLAFSVTDEALKAVFADFKVASARVIYRKRGPGAGRSKGFGFVDFESESEQQAALAKLNGKEVEGREITLKVAVNPEAKEEGEVEATPAPAA
ncbi:hypothetical protein T439DRAFT_324015 [Meredithblackwellia eburnea MCA 4105]